MINVSWIIFIAAVLNLLLGGFVFHKNKKNKLNIFFFLFCVVASLIGFIDFVFRFYPYVEIVKYAYAFSAILPFVATFWVWELGDKKMNKIYFYTLAFLSSVVFCISLFTNLVIEKVYYLTNFGQVIEEGFFFPEYSIFISLMIWIVIVKLYLIQKKSFSIKKIQAVYSLLGLAFYGAIASTVALILPTFFNIYSFTALDSPASLFFVGFTAYAVVRYRLMGIKMMFSRVYLYIAIALFSFISFHLVAAVKINYLGGVYTMKSLVFGILVSIVFSLIVLPFINYIQKSSDEIFFKGLNPRKVIKDVSIELSMIIDLDDFLKTFSKNIKKVLKATEVRILILEKKQEKKFSAKSFKSLSENKIKSIFDVKSLVIKAELRGKWDELEEQMEKNNISVISPLLSGGKTIGFIILGDKKDDNIYTKEDIDFLEIMSSQAAVALENALLYEEVDDLNTNLQEKVEEQTADIQKKAEHLEKLLAMRSEFLDVASHQLRTPVSVIKGMISMILEEKSLTPAKKKEFLESCLAKSYKLESIINDILKASEMDTEDFNLKLEPVNVGELVFEICKDKKTMAKEKGLDLNFFIGGKSVGLTKESPLDKGDTGGLKRLSNLKNSKTPHTPLIRGAYRGEPSLPEGLTVDSDDKYLTYAVANLINNAIQYTQKGKIDVKLKKVKNFLEIRVADTGMGIPKKDISRLFDKFERAENAVDAYTDGSGLGLFIAKKVVSAHGGEIKIEKSELGKGTVFLIRLPLSGEKK